MAYPTALSPFEWSMFKGAENGAMTFSISLGLQGTLDSIAFELAVSRAVRMHPFLSATIRSGDNTETDLNDESSDAARTSAGKRSGHKEDPAKTQQSNFHWVPVLDPQPFVSIIDSNQPFAYPGNESIDLQSEVGIRVWARHGNGQVEMRFQFHHACCDGLGAFLLIDNLLWCYHQNVWKLTETIHSNPLDTDRLALRSAGPKKKLSLVKRILRATVILPIRITKLFGRKPDPIIALNNVSESSNEACFSPSHVFDKELTQRLRASAKDHGASLNDLLIRDLFLTISHWNQKSNSKSTHKIRLMIPFSLRTKEHARMPAANCVSMVYMSAAAKLLNDPNRLLSSVTKQRKFIRKWQIEHSWNQSAAFVASSPFVTGLLERRTKNKRRIVTSVFTNLGQVFCHSDLPKIDGKLQSGNLILNSVIIVPPVDSSMEMTLGCNTYAEKLTIAVNFHKKRFAETDTNQFLASFVQQLEISAGARPAAADRLRS